jgi:predicted TIM-barrel fold metal-dependent hydrolase
MGQEFELMQRNVELYGDRIRGWKIYTAWGDIPNVSGWFIDDSIGLAFLEQVRKIGNRFGTPKVVAVHKGFALPGFDQRAASPRDVGPAARQYPDVTIVVYHSGYNSETVGPYPGDANVASSGLSVDALIKSLRENHWDATRFVPAGLAHGNVPNVFAEIGSTWRSVMHDPDQAAHLLGKLITCVGPGRVAWGTDSLWYGSPQPQIVALRAFQFSDRAKALYNLPYGLDGDVVDPRRNALDAASYLSAHPDVANWPVDKQGHPQRGAGLPGRSLGDAQGDELRRGPEGSGRLLPQPADAQARRPARVEYGSWTAHSPRHAELPAPRAASDMMF